MQMERQLQLTADGSHTLYIPEMDEHYHSVNGAIQESSHIFIGAGLHSVEKEDIQLLEIGFGTGLNALLTWKEAELSGRFRHITYHTIERYPLPEEITSRLNYGERVWPERKSCFDLLHRAEWNKPVDLSGCFTLHKIEGDSNTCPLPDNINLIYMDAFAPEKLQSLCHAVGIGEPEVDITAHAQAGNGVEGIEGISLEDGTTDAGLEKPGKHFLTRLTILALLMAYGLQITEPLEAQVERGLAVLGKALHAFGHQAQNALLLALQQQGEPLVVGESAEKGGIGLPVPQTAAQQFEQLRKQRGIGGGCFHKDKSKAPVINSGFCACRLPRQRSDACGTRSAGRTGCGPCGSRRV